MKYLGIDIGTTRIKALCYDASIERTVAVAAVPTPVVRTPVGQAHAPAAVVAAVLAVADEVLSGRGEALAGIAVASVGEEVVLVDERGEPVDDAIAWYSTVGREQATALAPALARLLPGPAAPDPSFSVFKLAWLSEHRPRVLRQAVTLTDLGSYVTAVLAGSAPGEFVMDWSHASRTGLFDPRGRAWIPEAAVLAGLTAVHLPRLVPSGSPVGTLRPDLVARWGTPVTVAVASGGHDHFCAAYACGVREPGDIFLSAGTSEAQLLLTDALPAELGGSAIDVGCFVDDRHYYLHRGLPSGHFFRQWRDLLYRGVDDGTLYREVAAAPPGSLGIGCRIDVAGRRLSLTDVPAAAERGALLRALLEGLARHGAEVSEDLAALAATPVRRVVAAGAPACQPVWQQLRGSASARPMTFITEPEPTAAGAAMLARRADPAGRRPETPEGR